MEMKDKNTFSSEEEKLRYIQIKIHECILECINTLNTVKEAIPLINTASSLNNMFFRSSVRKNISF